MAIALLFIAWLLTIAVMPVAGADDTLLFICSKNTPEMKIGSEGGNIKADDFLLYPIVYDITYHSSCSVPNQACFLYYTPTNVSLSNGTCNLLQFDFTWINETTRFSYYSIVLNDTGPQYHFNVTFPLSLVHPPLVFLPEASPSEGIPPEGTPPEEELPVEPPAVMVPSAIPPMNSVVPIEAPMPSPPPPLPPPLASPIHSPLDSVTPTVAPTTTPSTVPTTPPPANAVLPSWVYAASVGCGILICVPAVAALATRRRRRRKHKPPVQYKPL